MQRRPPATAWLFKEAAADTNEPGKSLPPVNDGGYTADAVPPAGGGGTVGRARLHALNAGSVLRLRRREGVATGRGKLAH